MTQVEELIDTVVVELAARKPITKRAANKQHSVQRKPNPHRLPQAPTKAPTRRTRVIGPPPPSVTPKGIDSTSDHGDVSIPKQGKKKAKGMRAKSGTNSPGAASKKTVVPQVRKPVGMKAGGDKVTPSGRRPLHYKVRNPLTPKSGGGKPQIPEWWLSHSVAWRRKYLESHKSSPLRKYLNITRDKAAKTAAQESKETRKAKHEEYLKKPKSSKSEPVPRKPGEPINSKGTKIYTPEILQERQKLGLDSRRKERDATSDNRAKKGDSIGIRDKWGDEEEREKNKNGTAQTPSGSPEADEAQKQIFDQINKAINPNTPTPDVIKQYNSGLKSGSSDFAQAQQAYQIRQNQETFRKLGRQSQAEVLKQWQADSQHRRDNSYKLGAENTKDVLGRMSSDMIHSVSQHIREAVKLGKQSYQAELQRVYRETERRRDQLLLDNNFYSDSDNSLSYNELKKLRDKQYQESGLSPKNGEFKLSDESRRALMSMYRDKGDSDLTDAQLVLKKSRQTAYNTLLKDKRFFKPSDATMSYDELAAHRHTQRVQRRLKHLLVATMAVAGIAVATAALVAGGSLSLYYLPDVAPWFVDRTTDAFSNLKSAGRSQGNGISAYRSTSSYEDDYSTVKDYLQQFQTVMASEPMPKDVVASMIRSGKPDDSKV